MAGRVLEAGWRGTSSAEGPRHRHNVRNEKLVMPGAGTSVPGKWSGRCRGLVGALLVCCSKSAQACVAGTG